MHDTIYILVSGGREYEDYETVNKYLSYFKIKYKNIIIIHGAARGLDSLAASWVLNQKNKNIKDIPFPISNEEWTKYQNYAGPRRNTIMLNYLLSVQEKGYKCCAVIFPGGSGTSNMHQQCIEAQVQTMKIKGNYTKTSKNKRNKK